MNAWREVQNALAEHRLGWQDIWKATVDRRAGQIVLIDNDGRKYTHPLGPPPATAARTQLLKQAASDE